MSINNLQQVLNNMGLEKLDAIHWNCSTPALVEASVRRRESHLVRQTGLRGDCFDACGGWPNV